MTALPVRSAGTTLAVASEIGAFQGTIAATVPYGTFLISAKNDSSVRSMEASSATPTLSVCLI